MSAWQSVAPADEYRSRLFRLVCSIVAEGNRRPDVAAHDSSHQRILAIPESSVLDLFAAVIDTTPADNGKSSAKVESPTFIAGDFEVNADFRQVTRRGEVVHLTPREYNLLLALARRSGAAVSRETLEEEVWKSALAPGSRTLDQHVVELRRKLEIDPKHPQHILTSRKFGFRCVGSWVGWRDPE